MIEADTIRGRWLAVCGHLGERGRRLFAAAEVRAAGYGGLAVVSEVTGLARSTIGRGLKDLDGPALPAGTERRAGSGRRPLTAKDPTLLEDLRCLAEPATMGDPMRPLMWVSKSWEKLAAALRTMDHQVSANTVGKLLLQLGFTRHVNRKTKSGADHPDRDGQFEHINARTTALQAAGQPVISVDTKKKELIGEYKNGGSDYRPEGCSDEVKDHDFPDQELGKAVPYGIYDVQANAGWVNVGIDHDTAEFAVNSIRCWYDKMGRDRYPKANHLMITADGGGSNGSRVRLWKVELQKLAEETGLTIEVCHYPPGTSKWNKIEHRLFCHITQNWRGKPLVSRQVVVDLIAATTTKTGLKVRCELDTNTYAKGIKVTDADMASLNIQFNAYHPDWNYTIIPRGSG
ncbi:MAG: ISAzo13 family transposase [Alphaproteobacteria bacterium]|nr:ISAzo13 family transposase [Alphaproteobacteria bacterium]